MSALLLALAVLAQPEASARLAGEHFAAGEAAFARGDFGAAALAFERAFGLAPRAAALLNAAEAWERAGELARSVESCERVIGLAGVGEGETREAERRVARLGPKIARVSVRGPQGWVIEVDGRGERRPLPADVALDPGQRAITAYASDGARRDQRVVTVDAEDRLELSFELDAPPIAAALPEARPIALVAEPGSAEPPLGAWVSFGVSAAAIVATVALGAMTVEAQASYANEPSIEGADAFFARRTGTNVALGVAVAAGAAGAVIWWLADPAGD